MSKRLALIVAAYNEQVELPAMLESLSQQRDKEFELVLVDNASIDATRKIMLAFKRKAPFTVTVLHEPTLGKTTALVTAIEHLRKQNGTDILAFSDADAYFDADWSHLLKQAYHDPDVAFTYCTEWYKEDDLDQAPNFANCLSTYSNMLFKARSGIGDYMNMGNCSVRLDAYTAVGGIDASWVKSEDTLLTVKLIAAGYVGAYSYGNVYFSARRLLDGDNALKWCLDQDTREIVHINGVELAKPVRNIQTSGKSTRDVSPELADAAITVRAERIFRRLLVHSLVDMSRNQTTYNNLRRTLQVASPLLLSEWEISRIGFRQSILEATNDPIAAYQAADICVRTHAGRYIVAGGRALRDLFVPQGMQTVHKILNAKNNLIEEPVAI